MNIIEMIRLEESNQGTISTIRVNKIILGVTLELADKLNKLCISSIPTGQYVVKPYSSAKYPHVYQVMDVPGRSKILIHVGNTDDDTEGCILVGSSVGKLRWNRAVLNSGNTFRKLRAILGDEDAHLTITEHYQMEDIITLKSSLYFTSGYKHQVKEDFTVFIPALAKYGEISYDFIRLKYGKLTLLKGFGWDGASGITFDTLSSFRGSAVHDALYRLMRQGLIPSECKVLADNILKFVCKKDGMWEWRAGMWHTFVDRFGNPSIDPRNKIKVKIAP